MKLIGLTGAAGAGKDTAAMFLEEEYDFHRYAFAWPVKDAASEKFGVPAYFFEDPELKDMPIEPWKMSPRQMAEFEGTECGREFYDYDIWIKRAQVAYDNALELSQRMFGPDGLVVSDVRFNNEAQWIHANGGDVVAIHNPAAAYSASHQSAGGIDPSLIDHTIQNDGDLAYMFKQFDRFMSPIH